MLTSSRKNTDRPSFLGYSQSSGTEEEDEQVRVCISLLGELQLWLEMNGTRVSVPIKSHRRQELLAYLAAIAPERQDRVSSGRILTDVFEHIAPGADVDNLRGLFQKHTQLLRKEVNEVAQSANFPKVQLFQFEKVDNSSTKWWLAKECKVVDLAAITECYEQMEVAKEAGEPTEGRLEDACNQLIRIYQSYQGDFLEKHLEQDEFYDADWIRIPFTRYRDMYLQALWDAALLEHTRAMLTTITNQERYRYAKRAASLYRMYALHAPKNPDLDLNAKKNRRQSERALRGYLRMCLWLKDGQGADDCYALYERIMKEEVSDWKPMAATVELLRMVRQQTGQQIPMLSLHQLSAPEAD